MTPGERVGRNGQKRKLTETKDDRIKARCVDQSGSIFHRFVARGGKLSHLPLQISWFYPLHWLMAFSSFSDRHGDRTTLPTAPQQKTQIRMQNICIWNSFKYTSLSLSLPSSASFNICFNKLVLRHETEIVSSQDCTEMLLVLPFAID